jgi:hypothetical protein
MVIVLLQMKKIIITIGMVLALFSFANSSWASISLSQSGYSYSSGGEFRAVTTTESFLGNYSPKAILNGGFETFCIESTVHFSPGQAYNYTLASTDSRGRNLSLGTAYLYSLFAQGNLSGYNYDNANRSQSAGLLQAAIWYLQGGQTVNGFAVPTVNNNPFYALSISMFGNNAMLANNGQYDVDVLQLTDASGRPAQNQLVHGAIVPEPSTIVAGALLLLPFGVSMFRVIRRTKHV